jgi:hypothetical protein
MTIFSKTAPTILIGFHYFLETISLNKNAPCGIFRKTTVFATGAEKQNLNFLKYGLTDTGLIYLIYRRNGPK